MEVPRSLLWAPGLASYIGAEGRGTVWVEAPPSSDHYKTRHPTLSTFENKEKTDVKFASANKLFF